MFKKHIISLVGVFIAANSFAFPCYFTLAKDSCWTDYDVKVIVMDAVKNKELLTVNIPKGKSWVREKFTCQPEQKLFYHASFSPVFWQSEVGKTYMALRYWILPASISKDQSAWVISVCYPQDFSAVPFPPTATGNCKCDFSVIPEVKPQ